MCREAGSSRRTAAARVIPLPRIGSEPTGTRNRLAPAAGSVRQVQRERTVAARLPDAIIREVGRHARASPEQDEIEETGIARAQQRAHSVNRNRNQQCQQILGEEEDLHREDEIEEERGERDAPAHRRPGHRDEERSAVSPAFAC